MPTYLDENGNPIPSGTPSAAPAPAKTYLDDSGNPIPGGAPSLDLSNKAGQGTYNMWDTAGKMHAVPYSLVPVVRGQGFQFDTNANPAGLTPMQQFIKDEAADPNRTGGTSMPMAAAGARWAGQPEPVSRQESLQRRAQAETNAPLPERVLTGVMKGGATIGRPVIDVANLAMGDNGNTPAETSQMLEGRTPAETAAKVGTIGAAIVPGLVTAPVPTALGLAGGAAASYAAGKTADALGADPKLSAVVGDVAGLAAGIGAGKAAPAVTRAGGGAVRSLLAGDVNAPIGTTDLTPAARYQSMKDMGIQPNAAEATNSKVLKSVQKANENSLAGAGTYTDMQAANLRALNKYTQSVLDSMSEDDSEAGGKAVQQALLKKHADLKTAATDAYADLDAQVGNQPLPGAAGLRQMAQDILDANAPYYKAHPELEPVKAMAIVRDLAGAKGSPKPAPTVIPGFGPTPPAPEVAPPRGMTYSELHRLRSDLLDFNNTNPDLVKNQANGWISRLAGIADHAITSNESGLTPDQVETFRNANEAWKFMKGTFDNPSHPFYDAVRTQTPSKLVNGMGLAKTPEMANALQAMLGPKEMGAIQRGVAENLLKTTKEGGFNFKTFQGQWNKLKPELREALFRPQQLQQLEDIGNAGTVLNTDLNPSGTAKLGQAIMESKGIMDPLKIPDNLIYHPLQYFVARKMNSPTFVDWLMQDRGLRPSNAAPPRP